MIIDYHSHLEWDYTNHRYKSEELLEDMSLNNIDVRVVSALEGRNIRHQNSAISKLVSKYPNRLIGSAIINPKDEDCLEEIKRVANDENFKCIEFDSLEHNYFPEEFQDIIFQVLEIVETKGLIVNVYTGWGPRTMPAQWAFYAKKYPNIKFVLLHMGTTDFGYGCIDLVPKYDNLYVETSSMYELPILRKAFKNIGTEKFLFGSHFPHKFTSCSINTFNLLELSDETRSKLFFENAKKILKVEENKIE